MSDVPVWRLFAYMNNDPDGERDEERVLADWQLEDVLRWCRVRGFDNIYIRRDPDKTATFEPADPVPVVHHMNVLPLQPRSSRGNQEPQTGRGPSAA